MENKQKSNLPTSFIQFISSIIEAEKKTDLWKSKLFYLPTERILSIFKEQSQEQPKYISENQDSSQCRDQQSKKIEDRQKDGSIKLQLSSILSFIQMSEQCDLTEQQQKVIQKYFNFSHNLSCCVEQFLKKLKPVNNRLILSIERQNIEAKQAMKGLFKSVLEGYEQIAPLRKRCAQQFSEIWGYFSHEQQLHKNSYNNTQLSREGLKQVMFQANIYGRVNFMYLKEYIFGEREEIEWTVLLGDKNLTFPQQKYRDKIELNIQQRNELNEQLIKRLSGRDSKLERNSVGVQLDSGFEKIIELDEENIVTEKVIVGNGGVGINDSQKRECDDIKEEDQQENKQKQQENEHKQQSNQQQQTPSVDFQIHPSHYSKTLQQINQIEELLEKTKQKYQKNKQQLQNETKIIKSQHIFKDKQRFTYLKNQQQSQQQIQIESEPNNTIPSKVTPNMKLRESANQLISISDYLESQENFTKINQLTPTPNNNNKQKHFTNIFSFKITSQNQHENLFLETPSPHLDDNSPQNKPKINLIKQQLDFYSNQNMVESHVELFFNRDKMMGKNNSQSEQANNYGYLQLRGNLQSKTTNTFNTTERREVGKIKKRSVSKDKSFIQTNTPLLTSTKTQITSEKSTPLKSQSTTPISALSKTFTFPENNPCYKNRNYEQYEAVLKQIKKQETEYKQILQARQKIINQKQYKKKKLTLDFNTKASSPQYSVHYKRYTPINSLVEVQRTQKPSKVSLQNSNRVSASTKPTISHSRYQEIMREIQTNSLARSRVSSKKRQQIVQKATSQARLRIQQIENRALKRLAKTDTHQQRYSTSRKSSSYLNLNTAVELDKESEIPKYKKTKQNVVNIANKSHKSPSPKNYFINDLLNQRPTTGLKISVNYRQKS